MSQTRSPYRVSLNRVLNAYLWALVVVLAAALPPMSAAAEEDSRQGFWKYIRLDVGTWITTGEGEWEIEFATVLSPEEGAPVIAGRSKLEFEHLTNPLITARTEVKPVRWLAFDAEISFGTSLSGRATDTDIGLPAGEEPVVAMVSKHHLGGDTTIFKTNAYLRVAPLKRDSENFVDVLVGYIYYRDSLNMTDGVLVLNVDAPDTVGPASGLNSLYDFTWKGIRVGARGQMDIPWRLKARAEAALIPWMDFDGDGFWNLRNLRFKQKAEGGIGVDALISLRRQFTDNLGLELGFNCVSLHVEDGEDIKHFPSGNVIRSDLREVQSLRYGPFLRFNLTF